MRIKMVGLSLLCGMGVVVSSFAEKMAIDEHDKKYEQENSGGYEKGLPQLYVCGDSISVGYSIPLKKELRGKVSVVHRKDLAALFPSIPKVRYSGKAHSLIALTKAVLESKEYKPDYLLLNCGLHDIARGGANLKKYKRDLKTLIDLAKAHKTTLVWLTITPRKENHPQNVKIEQFNAAAKELMKANHVAVIDLHKKTKELIASLGQKKVMKRDGIHFTALGYQKQATFIVEQLKPIVK